MSRCSGRKGTPNRQFCDYIEHGIGRSTRKSQSGHPTSDSVTDLLGTISEEHAEKSTGSDTEEPSSTQNRDEQQQSRGIGDSQQSIFDSQEVPLTPTVICREPGCNETSFMCGYCSTHSDSAQRSRETFALRNPTSNSGQEHSQEGRRSSAKPSRATFSDTDSDFKKRVQAFLVMKVYCRFLHEKQMSLEERASKCLKEYENLTKLWVEKKGPFYGHISKLFGSRAAWVTTDMLLRKTNSGKQEDIDSAWMQSKLRDIKNINTSKSAAKNLGNVVGVLQKVYAPLMNRLLPKERNPASGKNYAHYYDLVRRFQYLRLCDEKSASKMEQKEDIDLRIFLEGVNDVPESFVPQHWEAFLFFGVQDEHESGNPDPSIVSIITLKRDTNKESIKDSSSRENSRKRSLTMPSSSTTANNASEVLVEIKKKAKHETEDAILRKLQSLENCEGIGDELKRTLKEKYIDELKSFL